MCKPRRWGESMLSNIVSGDAFPAGLQIVMFHTIAGMVVVSPAQLVPVIQYRGGERCRCIPEYGSKISASSPSARGLTTLVRRQFLAHCRVRFVALDACQLC